MNIAKFGVQAKKFTFDNSPLILSAVGVMGTITTAVLTHKATIKACELVRNSEVERVGQADGLPDSYTAKGVDKFKLTWMCYLPPLTSCAITTGAIVFSHKISTGRLVGLAAAYSLTQEKQQEYKTKIQEKFGLGKEQQARDELAQERMDKNPNNQVILVGGSEVLCIDQFTGRYFKSDMESIKRAENDTNRQILRDGYASLSDFYERVGLPATSFSEECGWNGDKTVDLKFSAVVSPEGKPCISFDFDLQPIRDYVRGWAN